MKLFIILVMVALLAALCSAQPVDNLAPEQLDTSRALRFKRDSITAGYCPPGYIKGIHECISKMDAEYTDPNSAPDQPDTFGALRFKRPGITIGDCPPGYTRKGIFCIPDKDTADAEHTDPNSATDQPDTSGALRFKRSGNVIIGGCRTGYFRMGGFCIPDEDTVDAEHTDPNLAPDQPDTSGTVRFERSVNVIIGGCRSGYFRMGGFCIPDEYAVDAEHTDPNLEPDQPDTSGTLRFIMKGRCPTDYVRFGSICVPEEYAVDSEHTDPNLEPDQPDTSGNLRFKRNVDIMKGGCRSGYVRFGSFCIPDDDDDK